jgi:ribosome recycling factor
LTFVEEAARRPGEDLKSFIRRARQLVVGTTILIAKQVCDGLELLQKLIDDYSKKIEEIAAAKEKEILER